MRQISEIRSARHKRRALPAMYSLALLFLVLFLTNETTYSQFELVDLSSVVKDVKIRYNLTKNDVRRIRPMIERENEDVILIYSRYEGSSPGYSATLWREMIRRRSDFEARLDVELDSSWEIGGSCGTDRDGRTPSRSSKSTSMSIFLTSGSS